jgi:peptide/nickel transport system permease protein
MRLRDYIIRRLVLLIPVLLGVTLLTFLLTNLMPSDPVRLMIGEKGASEETLAMMRAHYGLDQPLYIRYFTYMRNLLRGDLGQAIHVSVSVNEAIMTRLPATIELGVAGLVLAVVFGILIGIISAVKSNTLIDHASRIFALTGVSMPIFWLGIMLLLLFYFRLGWLPGMGRLSIGINPPAFITGFYTIDSLFAGDFLAFKDSIAHLILPAFCLSWLEMAMIMRITRSSMLEVIRQDYIRTARSKGLSERVVIYRHALHNAMIPTITIVGLSVGALFGGAVLTETVFAWPGIGSFMVESITFKDIPVILGITVIMALANVFANLITDMLYGVLDPRIRYG